MSQVLSHGTFNWVDLLCKDIQRARAFYEPLFGWTYEEQPSYGGPPYGLFKKDGKQAAGVGQMPPPMLEQGVPPTWNTYILVDDIVSAETTVKANGGKLMFETVNIPGVGKTNWVTDPEGVVFVLWQDLGRPGAEIFNVPGSFSWNERATSDLSVVKSFYGSLSGWKFKDQTEGGITMSMIHNQEGREMGHVLVMDDAMKEKVPPYWAAYFTVADREQTIEQVKSLGGEIIMAPVEIQPGWFALMADNDGGKFYIFENRTS
ncbi:MAG: VOC family protein [Myxococcota bacterium]